MPNKNKILFIDDNPVDRTMLSRVLEKYNFEVFLAADALTGLVMAEEESPELILLDILLPGISGIELCKKIRENPVTHTIPIIFYSSIDTPKHLIDYASYGAQDYIQKTMPTDELVAAIRAILK